MLDYLQTKLHQRKVVNRMEGSRSYLKWLKRVAVLGLLLWYQLALPTAQAQTNELQATGIRPDIQVAEQKRLAVKKLFAVMGSEDLIKSIMPLMVNQMRLAMPQAGADFWREFQKEVNIGEVLEIYVRIYDKHFTLEEINGLTKFFDTPLGKKMIAEMPMVTKESMDVCTKWGADLGRRIEQKLSAERTNSSSHVGEKMSKPIASAEQTTAGPTKKLTEYQRRWIIQQSGYDPDKFTLSDDDNNIIPRQQQPVQLQPVDSPPAKQLSRSEKDAIIKQRGFSPDDVDLDETGLLLIPKTKSNPNTPRQNQPTFQYVIGVTDPSGKETTYYSINEPKAYGSGYKFKMFPTDIEITVAGSVQIMKLW